MALNSPLKELIWFSYGFYMTLIRSGLWNLTGLWCLLFRNWFSPFSINVDHSKSWWMTLFKCMTFIGGLFQPFCGLYRELLHLIFFSYLQNSIICLAFTNFHGLSWLKRRRNLDETGLSKLIIFTANSLLWPFFTLFNDL